MLPSSTTKIIPAARVMLGDPTHICLVVRDVERTAATYADVLGFGPWLVREVNTPESHGMVRGEPATYRLKFAYCRRGPLMYELVETVSGHTIYQDFLAANGEGLHHVGFAGAGLLDEELARWAAAGIEPLMVNRRGDPRYGWAYLDTQASFGCIVEIVCDPALGWWQSVALAGDLRGPLGGKVQT